MKRCIVVLGLLLMAVSVRAAGLEAGKDFVHVCQDAGAGAYEAFPDVCRLRDGRLLCVFYAGYGHVALPNEQLPKGGRISGAYSSDEGKTWSAAVTLYDGPDDDRDPSITQLRDGRLLLTYFSLRAKSEGKWDGLGSYVVESNDAGETWSEPRQINATYYCSSPVRELADGTLVLGLYQESGGNANGAVTRSTDGGKTWSAAIDIDNGGLRLDAETDVIALKDGRLYAAQRTEKEPMRFSISSDQGLTWTVSTPMGFPGHAPYLYRTPEGAIVCAHRLPNTSLHYSFDECATWGPNVEVDEHIGSYASMATLKDGSTLIVYYEEGNGSSIRARKFRLEKSGLTWLAW